MYGHANSTNFGFSPMNSEQFFNYTQERIEIVKELIKKSIVIPEGYQLTADSSFMHKHAVLRLMPTKRHVGARSIHFYLQVGYQGKTVGEEYLKTPSIETIRASCEVFPEREIWENDKSFGTDGTIAVTSFGCDDLAAAIRNLVATTMTHAPFVSFEWRKNAHDPLKLELFNGNDQKKLQAIWKSGNRWATFMGISCDTQGRAKGMAEDAAIAMISTQHQERLASLSI